MASRTQQRPRRESDSDENGSYMNNYERNRNQRKPIKYRNESSDESDHGERDYQGGRVNYGDSDGYMRDQRNQSQQSPAQNVRVVARSRPNPGSRPANPSGSNGGFIPRSSVGNSAEWRPKSIRVEGNPSRSYSDRNFDNQPVMKSYDDNRNSSEWVRGSRDSVGASADFEEVDDRDYRPNRQQPPSSWNASRNSSDNNMRNSNSNNNIRRRMEEEFYDEEEPHPRNTAAPPRRAPSNRYPLNDNQHQPRRQNRYEDEYDDVDEDRGVEGLQEEIEVLELSDQYGRKKPVPGRTTRPPSTSSSTYGQPQSQYPPSSNRTKSHPNANNRYDDSDGYQAPPARQQHLDPRDRDYRDRDRDPRSSYSRTNNYNNNNNNSNYRPGSGNARRGERDYEDDEEEDGNEQEEEEEGEGGERDEELPQHRPVSGRGTQQNRHSSNNQSQDAYSFSSYARSQAAAGKMLPRKSGRYDDGPVEDDDDVEDEDREDDNRADELEGEEDEDERGGGVGGEEEDDIEEIPCDPQGLGQGQGGGGTQKRRKKKTAQKLLQKSNWTEASGRNATNKGTGLTASSTTNSLTTAAYQYDTAQPFVLVAHPRGLRTPMVQCTIIRDRNSIHGKLYPTYELILEEPRKSLIIAQKMSLNRTSNYHLFDMTRGQAGHSLSKKSGNYLGKLRSKNAARLGYTLLSAKSDREEVGSVLFEKVTLLDQIQDGNQPRRMKILLPRIDANHLPVSVSAATYGVESLMDVLQAVDDNKRQLPVDFVLLQTKDPVFENGNYRLNFHGRVSLPSVKNFQIVTCDDINDVKCQFGKVDKDVFHLDYKAPFTAFEAFSIALCQFNL